MLEKLHDIYIKGGCFDVETRLTDILSKRVNIVYGRNGSGKSSIARGFASLTGQDNGFEVSFDNNADRMTEHLYVFNEDFIRDNLQINDSGLETIVTLGAQVDVDNQIKGLEEQINEKNDELEKVTQERGTLVETRDTNAKSLDDWLKKGLYTTNGQKVLQTIGKKQVSRHLDDIRNDGMNAQQPLEVMADAFKKDLTKLLAISDGIEIDWKSPDLPGEDSAQEVNKLLQTALQMPKQLSDDEKTIAEIARSSNLAHYIDDTLKRFKDEGMDYCPLCHRPIDDEYKDKLFVAIASLRDESSKQFRSELEEASNALKPVELENLPEADYYKAAVDQCKVAAEELNGVLNKMREVLVQKNNHLYESWGNVDEKDFADKLNKCKDSIKALKDIIAQQNASIKQKMMLVNDLLLRNRQIAYLTYESTFKTWADAVGKIGTLDADIAKITDDIKKKSDDLASLKSELKNTKVALDYINSCLNYIFMDDSRMKLSENETGRYNLLVRGKEVAPQNVSTGERNVIALSYFFANILKGKSLVDAFMKEMLVVIDDPISSFDTNNRMGILSLLKVRIYDILKGNDRSKMLFLTHDIQTVNDIAAIYKALQNNEVRWQKIFKDEDGMPPYLELINHQLIPQKSIKANTYRRLLDEIIAFAAGGDSDYFVEDSIGNVIRRFVEMYKGFKYAGGDLNRIFTDKDVQDQLPNQLQSYFSHSNVLVVLNSLSHEGYAEQLEFDKTFGEKELRALAKKVLAFIYKTDYNHLKYTLSDEAYLSQIEQYYDECLTLAQSLEVKNNVGNITQLIERYEGKVHIVERDSHGFHCGECAIKTRWGVDLQAGDKICIDSVVKNNNRYSPYPLYAKQWNIEEYGNNHVYY